MSIPPEAGGLSEQPVEEVKTEEAKPAEKKRTRRSKHRKSGIGRFFDGCMSLALLASVGFFAAECVISPVVDTISKVRVYYDRGLEGERELKVSNDAALLRAATVRFLASGDRLGHGAVLESGDNLFIYTVGHVAEVLARYYRNNSAMKVPGVNTYPINPNALYNPWKEQDEKNRGRQQDWAAVMYIDPAMRQAFTQAIAERIIQPLTFAKKPLNKNGEIVAIPREEAGVYTLYRAKRYLQAENLWELELANPEGTRLCRGDSGSPVLRLPLNGETYGVLAAGLGFSPDNPISEKECGATNYIRPNG